MNENLTIILGPLVLIHIFYIAAVIKKNLSVIDTAWGLGFILMTAIGSFLSHYSRPREQILLLLIAIWGFRLAFYIHSRNHGKGEDFRYANWRAQWGQRTNLIAYFKVYWLQFFLMLVVGLPIFAAHSSSELSLYWFNFTGIGIWIIGFLWETVADFQKNKFKTRVENKNKVCREGLWAYSRHPNYFGEALLWWGIGFVCLDGNNFWAMLGPVFITLLLWKVSGVPLVEQRHANNPEYQSYKAQTPVLIPSLKLILKRK
jgi:steroid 5-alpha reductase family enzyme